MRVPWHPFRASKRSRGWTVEIAFPWSGFVHGGYRASRPRPGDQWRANFSRVEWQTRVVNGRIEKVPETKEDNWVWSPQGQIDMHLPAYWGYVQFERTSSVPFRKDRQWRTRMQLQQVFEAQLVFRGTHGRWAAALTELSLTDSKGITMEPGGQGWRAAAGGLTIDQDARIAAVR